MGQLFGISDFRLSENGGGHLNPNWYFTDIYHNSGSGGPWRKEIKIEADFPHRRAIHWDHFGHKESHSKPQHRKLRVEIRRFIERQCLGCVIYKVEDQSYEYLYELDAKYRSGYGDTWRRSGVYHGYYVFHFEEESDAALFALKFAGLVTEMSNRNPSRDVPEDQIEHAQREKWKGERSSWW